MTRTLSLRRALTLLVLITGLLPMLGVALLLIFWLKPHMEEHVAQGNQSLATAISTQVERYLTSPQSALRSFASHAQEYRQQGFLQTALDTLFEANDLFETIYLVDAHHRIIALTTPRNSRIQPGDFIGLDLSGSPTLRRVRTGDRNIWSDAYQSPISSRSVAATAAEAADLLVVGEISLHRMSDYVRRMAGEQATVTILDRRGLVVAHPDPRMANEQVNYSHLPILQHQASRATEKFELDRTPVIGTLAEVANLDWHVLVTQPLAVVQRQIMLTGMILLALSAIVLLISWWIGLDIVRRVSQRFEQLAELSDRLTRGDYPTHWPEQTLREAERLNDNLRRMSEAVREREADWRELNQTLEEKVEARTASLQQAQETLVRSEKLAALGALVAGVAHELNTPIGNGLMAASALEDSSKAFAERSREGLRRSELESYVRHTLEASGLVVRNLNRAAELVASFKQVAIDQTTSHRRKFDLAEVIQEIVTTLAPTLRKAQCTLDIDVPPEIYLDSYPGPLGQVLVNLLTNAIVHAYQGKPGTIALSARLIDQDRIALSVSDQGRGIAPEHLGHIFDPFFTTRFGEGGSGLGLHICHNFVTSLLGGQIDVRSQPGQGSCFTLTLPRTAPAETKPSA